MRHSELFGKIAGALAKAQSEYTPVPKKKTAKVKTKAGYEYEYRYADLADCLEMALPLIAKNGIAFMQPHEITDGRLRVTTLLVHESGEWMQSDGIEISEEGTPQDFGGESTYFRRYDGCSFIGVAPDEDTDAQGSGLKQRKTPAQVMPPPNAPPASATSHPVEEGNFDLRGDLLECVIKGVTDKTTKGGKAYCAVTLNGRIEGFNWVSNWHGSLTPALKDAIGKPCIIKISRKMSEDGKSVQFLNLEDVLYVDGVDYAEGKPVLKTEESHA
jgi:hypothetical protein